MDDAEDATEAATVAGCAIDAVATGELVAFATTIEAEAKDLGSVDDFFSSGLKDKFAEGQIAAVGHLGTGEKPNAIGFRWINGKSKVVALGVGKGFL